MVLLTGGISSLGLIATDVSRYLLITNECNISSYYSSIFEVTIYIIINILRVFFNLQFAWDAGFKSILTWGFRKSGFKLEDFLSFDMKRKNRVLFWFLVIFVSGLFIAAAIGLTVGSATLGHFRDTIFVNRCDEVMVDDKIATSDAHATAKSLAYFSTVIVCFYSVKIFYSSKCKWKEGTGNMTISEWIPKPRPQPEGEAVTLEPTTGPKSLGKVLDDKLYSLYNDYIEVGKKTSLERNALSRWFVVMYLVYLIYVLIHLVHVMRILSLGLHENIFDITSTIMNILLHFAAFMFPYYMGITLNSAHHSYHKEIIDTYLGIEIVLNDAHYLCKPGNYIKALIHKEGQAEDEDDEEEDDEEEDDKAPCIPKREELHDVDSSTRREVKKIYKEYFKEALKVQTSVITTKVAEFDFIPSFLSISIPLDSHGYTFAVLLTVFSIVLSFLQ